MSFWSHIGHMTLPISQVIPKELQQKWQKEVEALNPKLGGTPERPISALLVVLDVPEEMVVVCTAGEAWSHAQTSIYLRLGPMHIPVFWLGLYQRALCPLGHLMCLWVCPRITNVPFGF